VTLLAEARQQPAALTSAVKVAIVVGEDNGIIDGYNRMEIAEELGRNGPESRVRKRPPVTTSLGVTPGRAGL
jgi:hypothetical protein